MEPNQPKNRILERIDELCKLRGLSHYALAKLSDIPQSTFCNMFARNTAPSLPLLIKLCNGLNLPLSDFFLDLEDIPMCLALTEEEVEILDRFRKLSPHNQELLNVYLEGLIKNN